jgi:hypothetical protein|tara:strand:+ start:1141 stop:1383 length:243 start_codon:yes stop_codon:yes gene_type:complete
MLMTAKSKKPPAPSLEQEAKAFIKSKETTTVNVPKSLSSHKEQLAASVLAGLLGSSGGNRAEELVQEAYRYVDLLLQYKK